MAYQLREGVKQTPFYFGKEDPWKRVPSFIIDKIKQEQREKARQYDNHRPQPSLYDDYYRQPQHPQQKKDEERGVVIVDMTVTPSHSLLEQML